MGFDGISLNINEDDYETHELKQKLKKLLSDNGLEVVEYVPVLGGVNLYKQTEEYIALFEKNIKFMEEMGFGIIRVATTHEKLPEGMSYDTAKDKTVQIFKRCAKIAATNGIEVAWEFEPNHIFNKPSVVSEIVNSVDEPNFRIMFDTSHALMGAVVGAGEKGILKGGIEEYCELLKDKIGVVHLIDCDGTLYNENETSKHIPFGMGIIDFDKVIPAILDKGNFKGEWWVIDLFGWDDPWNAIEKCKDYLDKINVKFCK